MVFAICSLVWCSIFSPLQNSVKVNERSRTVLVGSEFQVAGPKVAELRDPSVSHKLRARDGDDDQLLATHICQPSTTVQHDEDTC